MRSVISFLRRKDRQSSKRHPKCSAFFRTDCNVILRILAPSAPTRERAASFSSSRPAIREASPTAILSSDRQPIRSCSRCAAFRSTAKPTKLLPDETDQGLSPGQGILATAYGVHKRVGKGDRHALRRRLSLLRALGDARRRGAAGKLWAARALSDADPRHRERQAL